MESRGAVVAATGNRGDWRPCSTTRDWATRRLARAGPAPPARTTPAGSTGNIFRAMGTNKALWQFQNLPDGLYRVGGHLDGFRYACLQRHVQDVRRHARGGPDERGTSAWRPPGSMPRAGRGESSVRSTSPTENVLGGTERLGRRDRGGRLHLPDRPAFDRFGPPPLPIHCFGAAV